MDPSLLSVGLKTAPNQLSASADADHAGADDRRSVSGWAIMLAGAMIAWLSRKGSGMYALAKHIGTRVHRMREFAAGDKPEVKL